MALISRIFQNRNKSRNQSFKWIGSNTKERWSSPGFEKSQVRLVLFSDHDIKDRKLLFDSESVHIEPLQPNVKTTASRLTRPEKGPPPGHTGQDGGGSYHPSGCRYSYSKPRSDTTILGEMMYGSIAMAYKGSTLKIHTIRSPPQLMISKVFTEKPTRETTSSDLDKESLDGCSIGSVGLESAPRPISEKPTVSLIPLSMAQSIPVEIPSPPRKSSVIDNDDSGFAASVSLASSASSLGASFPSPSSANSASSYNTMHRRLKRSVDTSFEYNFQKRQSDETLLHVPASKRPYKFGMGIVFTLPENPENRRHFEKFLFSHITLIESHINKMQVTVEKTILSVREKPSCRKSVFLQGNIEALETFQQSLYDLYMAPRLTEPAWLNMMCFSMQRVKLCQSFLKDFMSVIEKFDTKSNKFFVSSMLTAVLTYHLAWVPTVTPAGGVHSRTYLDKHTAKWLDTLARSHPYNPLWAQLSDLHGAIGFPLRLCRTVVVGKKAAVVCQMLYILSYFIRCSEVLENVMQCPLNVSEEETFDDMINALDMSPIKETGLSRNNSDTSIDGELEIASEAGESPPPDVEETQFVLSCEGLPGYPQVKTNAMNKSQNSQLELLSPPSSQFCTNCECGRATPTSSLSPQSHRTQLEHSVTGCDVMECSAMSKSGSTVVSIHSDKTLSPTDSCHHIEMERKSDSYSNSAQDHLDSNNCNTGAKNCAGHEKVSTGCSPKSTGQCKLSSSSVDELPRLDSIKYVGQASDFPDVLPGLRTENDALTDSQEIGLEPEVRRRRPRVKGLSVPYDRAEQISQDSGVFDGSMECRTTRGSSLCFVQTFEESTETIGTESEDIEDSELVTQEGSSDDMESSAFDGKHSYSRNNSIFDEYFPDGNTSPTDLPKIGIKRINKVVNCDKLRRMASIEGSNGFMDEYINEPLPDVAGSQCQNCFCKDSSPQKDRISLREGHFEDDSHNISMMPAGRAKDQVEQALKLMKSSTEDLLNVGDLEMKMTKETSKKKKVPTATLR